MTEKRVFIYGTLKQGFPNHHLNRGTRIDGDFVTMKHYPLYLVGSRQSPWLINTPGTGEQVFGEVYRVDTATLAELDKLERVDQADGYRRERIEVVHVATKQTCHVYAYFHSPEQVGSEPVKSAPLDRYTLEHARGYRRRSG